jgi:hypothetical protein
MANCTRLDTSWIVQVEQSTDLILTTDSSTFEGGWACDLLESEINTLALRRARVQISAFGNDWNNNRS